MLIAAHRWDVEGALRAGLRAAFVERSERVPELSQLRAIGKTLDDVFSKVLIHTPRMGSVRPYLQSGFSTEAVVER